MTNITVLKDENLGGVEREYREVVRKAAVGEYVKVFGHFCRKANGIFKVERVIDERDGYGDTIMYTIDGDPDFGTPYGSGNAYLTLEPSDIIRINTPDGEGKAARFRMVDRKAAVGERVLIVNPDFDADEHGDYTTGDTAIITSSNTDSYDVYYLAEKSADKEIAVYAKEYRVLEPLTSVEPAPTSEPLSAKPAPDQAAEIIAKLTTRVASLERRVTMLEVANAKPIPRRTAKPAPHPSFTKCAVKSPQEIRDDIVKRAKEDIEVVKTPWNINADPKPLVYVFRQYVVDVEFIVNREKRTVVAIARWRATGAIVNKGIAKCAPGDVFNAHIGRAIALRRALGLDIPEEYVSAPQPTEVRVGDYVYNSAQTKRMLIVTPDNIRFGKFLTQGFAEEMKLKIIDDSREDESDSAEPRKEVA